MTKTTGNVDAPAAYCMSLNVKGGIPPSEAAALAIIEGVPIMEVISILAG